MNEINFNASGLASLMALQVRQETSEIAGKTTGGISDGREALTVTVTDTTSLDGLEGISSDEPTRDDAVGLLMTQAFADLPTPAMPKFKD